MAIIDVVRWTPQSHETVFAWRFPHTNLSTYTRLIVQESQEALLFSKGKIVGKFSAGSHILDTENLPILRVLYGIPFGGKNPFTAEVWFVNKLHPFNLDWQVDRMVVHDADYDTQLPLLAAGQYGLQVKDSERFLVKVVGARASYSQAQLTEQFQGEIATKTKSAIVQFMLQHHVGYKQITAYLDTLSEYLTRILAPFWEELGFELTKFYVNVVDIDVNTPEGLRIKEALAQQSSMNITGHTWQQERVFDTAERALSQLGNSEGGLLGGLLAINMMGGLSNVGSSSLLQPQYSKSFSGETTESYAVGQAQGSIPRMVYCSHCAKPYPGTNAYCPHCGDPYRPCPHCGADNEAEAKRCVRCGGRLQEDKKSPQAEAALGGRCMGCGKEMPRDAKFCPHCGVKRQV